MKNKTITIPILNNVWSVDVVMGNEKYMEKVVIKKGYKQDVDMVYDKEIAGACYDKKGHVPLIIVKGKINNPRVIGVLAHEAVHAVSDIFDKLDDENKVGEVFCHSVQAVVRETLIAFKK